MNEWVNECIIKRICDPLHSDGDVEAMIPSSKFPTGILETHGSLSKPDEAFWLLLFNAFYLLCGWPPAAAGNLERCHYAGTALSPTISLEMSMGLAKSKGSGMRWPG